MLTDKILLISESFATDYFSKVEHYTNPVNAGKIDDFFKQHFESKIEAASNIYSFDGTDAHINISGPLSPAGPDLYDVFYGFGGCSYNAIVEAAALAAEEVDPTTGKVKFHMNTPGGTVNGVDSTFQAIKNLSATHTTVAVNHGMIASAGVWLAAGCSRIEASTPVAFTGSIGVVISTYDMTEMFERMGIKKVVITNHEATEKRADISTNEGQKIIREELDAIYGVFKSRVIEGRKNMTAEIIDGLKGSVKVAAEALQIGLIDSIEGISQPPATAGKTKEEAQKMATFQEFLAENPAEKAKYDADIKAATDLARTEGETAGKASGIKEMKAISDVVTPIISSSHYPDAIKTRVIEKAQSGDIEAIKDYVSMYDMTTEGIATAQAIEEEGDETPPTGQVSKEEQAEGEFQARMKKSGRA